MTIECPVCTLFLRSGMSLAEHLDTHPKENVIRALVDMVKNDGLSYNESLEDMVTNEIIPVEGVVPVSAALAGPSNSSNNSNSSSSISNTVTVRPTERTAASVGIYEAQPPLFLDNALLVATSAAPGSNSNSAVSSSHPSQFTVVKTIDVHGVPSFQLNNVTLVKRELVPSVPAMAAGAPAPLPPPPPLPSGTVGTVQNELSTVLGEGDLTEPNGGPSSARVFYPRYTNELYSGPPPPYSRAISSTVASSTQIAPVAQQQTVQLNLTKGSGGSSAGLGVVGQQIQLLAKNLTETSSAFKQYPSAMVSVPVERYEEVTNLPAQAATLAAAPTPKVMYGAGVTPAAASTARANIQPITTTTNTAYLTDQLTTSVTTSTSSVTTFTTTTTTASGTKTTVSSTPSSKTNGVKVLSNVKVHTDLKDFQDIIMHLNAGQMSIVGDKTTMIPSITERRLSAAGQMPIVGDKTTLIQTISERRMSTYAASAPGRSLLAITSMKQEYPVEEQQPQQQQQQQQQQQPEQLCTIMETNKTEIEDMADDYDHEVEYSGSWQEAGDHYTDGERRGPEEWEEEEEEDVEVDVKRFRSNSEQRELLTAAAVAEAAASSSSPNEEERAASVGGGSASGCTTTTTNAMVTSVIRKTPQPMVVPCATSSPPVAQSPEAKSNVKLVFRVAGNGAPPTTVTISPAEPSSAPKIVRAWQGIKVEEGTDGRFVPATTAVAVPATEGTTTTNGGGAVGTAIAVAAPPTPLPSTSISTVDYAANQRQRFRPPKKLSIKPKRTQMEAPLPSSSSNASAPGKDGSAVQLQGMGVAKPPPATTMVMATALTTLADVVCTSAAASASQQSSPPPSQQHTSSKEHFSSSSSFNGITAVIQKTDATVQLEPPTARGNEGAIDAEAFPHHPHGTNPIIKQEYGRLPKPSDNRPYGYGHVVRPSYGFVPTSLGSVTLQAASTSGTGGRIMAHRPSSEIDVGAYNISYVGETGETVYHPLPPKRDNKAFAEQEVRGENGEGTSAGTAVTALPPDSQREEKETQHGGAVERMEVEEEDDDGLELEEEEEEEEDDEDEDEEEEDEKELGEDDLIEEDEKDGHEDEELEQEEEEEEQEERLDSEEDDDYDEDDVYDIGPYDTQRSCHASPQQTEQQQQLLRRATTAPEAAAHQVAETEANARIDQYERSLLVDKSHGKESSEQQVASVSSSLVVTRLVPAFSGTLTDEEKDMLEAGPSRRLLDRTAIRRPKERNTNTGSFQPSSNYGASTKEEPEPVAETVSKVEAEAYDDCSDSKDFLEQSLSSNHALLGAGGTVATNEPIQPSIEPLVTLKTAKTEPCVDEGQDDEQEDMSMSSFLDLSSARKSNSSLQGTVTTDTSSSSSSSQHSNTNITTCLSHHSHSNLSHRSAASGCKESGGEGSGASAGSRSLLSSGSSLASNSMERAPSTESLNIRTDEKMPAKGEISEQESNGDMDMTSWNHRMYAVVENMPIYPSSYDLSTAQECWNLSSRNQGIFAVTDHFYHQQQQQQQQQQHNNGGSNNNSHGGTTVNAQYMTSRVAFQFASTGHQHLQQQQQQQQQQQHGSTDAPLNDGLMQTSKVEPDMNVDSDSEDVAMPKMRFSDMMVGRLHEPPGTYDEVGSSHHHQQPPCETRYEETVGTTSYFGVATCSAVSLMQQSADQTAANRSKPSGSGVTRSYRCTLCPKVFVSVKQRRLHQHSEHADDMVALASSQQPKMGVKDGNQLAADGRLQQPAQQQQQQRQPQLPQPQQLFKREPIAVVMDYHWMKQEIERKSEAAMRSSRLLMASGSGTSGVVAPGTSGAAGGEMSQSLQLVLEQQQQQQHVQSDGTVATTVGGGELVVGTIPPAAMAAATAFAVAARNRSYVCSTCNKQFDRFNTFNEHLLEHPVECSTCGRHFKQWRNFSLHIKRHLGIKEHQCRMCGKRFVIKQKLIEHMRVHTGHAPIKCKLCNRTFKRFSNLAQHRKRYHLNRTVVKEEYVCQLCGEVFHTMAKMEWHKETHEKKPKSCPYCREKFIHRNSLTRHIRLSHTDKYAKLENKTEPCSVCQQPYTKTSMRRHMETHTKERMAYACGICNKRFTTNWNLKQHKWTHTNPTMKPFQCTYCPSAFVRESDFVTHVNAHRSIRPYTCNHCGSQFIRKYNWIRHTREHEIDKGHRCDVCGRQFHRKYYLTEHKRIHTGERPFACNICGKTSATKTNHNKHVRIHHARDPLTAEG